MSLQLAPLSIDSEQEIQVLITLMGQLRICNYVTVSALVFMLYDIIINLKKEIPLVWGYNQSNDPFHCFRKVKQVLVRLLFIFSRYYGLVFLTIMFAVNNTTGLSVTRYYYYLILAGTVLYVTIVNVILAMRINALYGGQRCCGAFLFSLVVGEFLVEFSICAVMAVRTAAVVVSPPLGIPWPGCMLSSNITPTFTLASWLVALFVSTIFCAMTLKSILFDKNEETLGLQDRLRLSPRARVLLYDGVTICFLTFAIVLVSTVVLTVVQNELAVLPVSLLVAIYSYCASRLILNVRAVKDELRLVDVPDDPDLPLAAFSDIARA